MPVIMRGKRKGEKFEIGQMSNDWISDHNTSQIYNPTSLRFNVAEIARLKADKSPGIFWKLYMITSHVNLNEAKGYNYKLVRR